MLDITLRPLKDKSFDPICSLVPIFISPTLLTGIGFLTGIGSCVAAAQHQPGWAVGLWAVNRCLDCLDGALARSRNDPSDLGGFLDLLSDFIIYSAIPICCTLGMDELTDNQNWRQLRRRWLAVALAESSFHINNFILFFLAALAAREDNKGKDLKSKKMKELTSVNMSPALVEGFESGLIFTVMLAWPIYTEALCWVLSAGVIVGIVQRTNGAISALKDNS